jgi:serine/threonine-protein kinase HipA
MNKKRCLYCYRELGDENADFHAKCSREFFGTPVPPALDYGNQQMHDLAKQIVVRSVAVTGVQPKLSLTIEPIPGDPKNSRFTIVGLWGNFILKPPAGEFPNLPENEDLTMHLAEHFGILTAAHSLIRLNSGELAYLTKRFDRAKQGKLAVEDMCQLTETLTADKYRGSMEKVGKHLAKYSSRPGLDAINFFETALFCFLAGNADMHLKNFSLLTGPEGETTLSPAYDLVCTKLVLPDDKDETGLTINARKRRLTRSDFDSLAANLKIPIRSQENSYDKFAKKLPDAMQWIHNSFLPQAMKDAYGLLLKENAAKMGLP